MAAISSYRRRVYDKWRKKKEVRESFKNQAKEQKERDTVFDVLIQVIEGRKEVTAVSSRSKESRILSTNFRIEESRTW